MSEQKYGGDKRKLPTSEEIDAMEAFPNSAQQDQLQNQRHDHECEVLCIDLQEIFDELETADRKDRPKLILRLKSINLMMRALHCKICLPS